MTRGRFCIQQCYQQCEYVYGCMYQREKHYQNVVSHLSMLVYLRVAVVMFTMVRVMGMGCRCGLAFLEFG